MSQEVIDAIRVLRIELGIANDKVAAAAGLNPRDLDILDVIDRDGPCTPSYLAARTGVPAATLSGVLARLVAKGWVARVTDPADGRSARLSSTDRFDELRALYRAGDGAVRRLAATLDTDDRAVILAFLTATADAVRAASDRLNAEDAAP